MKCNVSKEAVLDFILRQLSFLYPLNNEEREGLEPALDDAWNRASHCFSCCSNKYFVQNGESIFDPYHGGQYTIFLYLFSNSLHQHNHTAASKIYLLNRALHSVDLYHEVALPAIWRLDHPLGSVLGRATYSDYLSFAQGCTVGSIGSDYPRLGKLITLAPGSYVLGKSVIGDCCIVAPRCMVKNEVIPPFSLVFGESPHLIVKQRDASYFSRHYEGIWKDPDQLIEKIRSNPSI